MDAISFVLGVKSAQLRSSQLKDLVYRGRRLARENPDGSMAVDDEDDEEGEGEGTARKAWVSAVYLDAEDKEWTFQRTVSTTGASEYKLNNRTVTYSAYNAALVSHNILVKAKNFLVFQGDVEAVASQSPRELSKLIEQISGSLELAGEYDKAKEDLDKATENATFNFSKRRGIAGEIKQYKEQKGEAERFEAMEQEKVRAHIPFVSFAENFDLLNWLRTRSFCIESCLSCSTSRNQLNETHTKYEQRIKICLDSVRSNAFMKRHWTRPGLTRQGLVQASCRWRRRSRKGKSLWI
ncbi:hypothetical protein GYMLUDRAFT_729729 [Collybiopsis luxurians FD-317 M1]|nr:hypothetical protein GYMLUDRAFT_729729 [Collybiopsis luxurians FD-317 M1]